MASTADRVELGKIRVDPDDAELLRRLSAASGAPVSELRRRAYRDYCMHHLATIVAYETRTRDDA